MVPAGFTVRVRAVTVIAAAAALLAGPAARGDAFAPQVLVYGDSLVFEAAPYANDLIADVAGVEGVARGVGGSATCDWLPGMRVDAGRYRPKVVVLAFSGNAFTPCMQDGEGRPLRGDAWLARYRAATQEAIGLFTAVGAHVWLGTAPISLLAEKKREDDVWRLARMAHELAAQHPMVHVADAAAGLLDHGFWTRTKPCLPNEPCTGGVDERGRRVNSIRAHDTAHFCPVPYSGVTEQCPAHASGALRYALGLLAPPLRAMGWWDPGRVGRSMAAGWT